MSRRHAHEDLDQSFMKHRPSPGSADVSRSARILLRAGAPALLALGLCTSAHARGSITGVCPDGSMFVVKRAADIPCDDSKQVEPHDLPPIRPEYLPRPYGWQVFHDKQDPNNPYNLVDKATAIREGGQPIDEEPEAPTPTTDPAPRQQAALPPVTAPRPAAPTTLEVTAEERRDLALIVELSQRRSAARFASEDEAMVVELAHSPAFEDRLHTHFGGEPLGPVVLFSAEASADTEFHANFTFVQGHSAHHPRGDDPRRRAMLTGELGSLAAGDAVLGYVVLPPETDLTQPVDIYWNDRRISAALAQ